MAMSKTELKQALNAALDDEYKARATYRKVIKAWGEIRPFVNIVEAEERHIQVLLPLFEQYEFPLPDDPWPARVTLPASVLDACQTGVEAEIENAELYNRLLEMARDYPDVQAVFRQLQRAAQENHLPAFQRCVERGGSGGCGGGTGQRSRQGRGAGHDLRGNR